MLVQKVVQAHSTHGRHAWVLQGLGQQARSLASAYVICWLPSLSFGALVKFLQSRHWLSMGATVR